jgi:hypothetical protein
MKFHSDLKNNILRDYKNNFCSPLAQKSSGEEGFKKIAVFTGFWPKYDLEMKFKVKS